MFKRYWPGFPILNDLLVNVQLTFTNLKTLSSMLIEALTLTVFITADRHGNI